MSEVTLSELYEPGISEDEFLARYDRWEAGALKRLMGYDVETESKSPVQSSPTATPPTFSFARKKASEVESEIQREILSSLISQLQGIIVSLFSSFDD